MLVTHDVEEAIVLADRIIVIHQGQIDLDLPINLPRPRSQGHFILYLGDEFREFQPTIIQLPKA